LKVTEKKEEYPMSPPGWFAVCARTKARKGPLISFAQPKQRAPTKTNTRLQTTGTPKPKLWWGGGGRHSQEGTQPPGAILDQPGKGKPSSPLGREKELGERAVQNKIFTLWGKQRCWTLGLVRRACPKRMRRRTGRETLLKELVKPSPNQGTVVSANGDGGKVLVSVTTIPHGTGGGVGGVLKVPRCSGKKGTGETNGGEPR